MTDDEAKARIDALHDEAPAILAEQGAVAAGERASQMQHSWKFVAVKERYKRKCPVNSTGHSWDNQMCGSV